jgi:hypothetical protein
MGILITGLMLFVAFRLYENNEMSGAAFIGILGILFAAGYFIEGANKAKEVVGKKSSSRRMGGMQ